MFSSCAGTDLYEFAYSRRRAANHIAGATNTLIDIGFAERLLHRPDNGFSEFCFVVGGFIFACLFLRGRLIPLWLAWTGVVTIGLQLLCVPLHIAGIVPGQIVNLVWLSILLYEVPLGIWLIAGRRYRAGFISESKSDTLEA